MHDWVLAQNIIGAINKNFKAQKNVPNGFLIDNPTQNTSPKIRWRIKD